MTQKHRNGSREYAYEDIRNIIGMLEAGYKFEPIARSHDRTKSAIKTLAHRWDKFKKGNTKNTSQKLQRMFERYQNEPKHKLSYHYEYEIAAPDKKKIDYKFAILIIIFLVFMTASNLAWYYFFSQKTDPKAPIKEKVVTVCAWFSPVRADAYRACNGKIAKYEGDDSSPKFTCK